MSETPKAEARENVVVEQGEKGTARGAAWFICFASHIEFLVGDDVIWDADRYSP